MPIKVPIIVAGVLLFLVVPSFADFYTDWLWFERVGFEQVFTRTLISQVLLGVTVFVIAFGLLLGGLRLALQEMTKPYLVIGGGPD
ncbi:MAG TPA: hypothetical protein DCP38_03825, partial [Acidobacteria bacterium]|nr:hypothetical protein [Acidobacteriota bacterium]